MVFVLSIGIYVVADPGEEGDCGCDDTGYSCEGITGGCCDESDESMVAYFVFDCPPGTYGFNGMCCDIPVYEYNVGYPDKSGAVGFCNCEHGQFEQDWSEEFGLLTYPCLPENYEAICTHFYGD